MAADEGTSERSTPPGGDDASEPHGVEEIYLEMVRLLADPLTAISNYTEAAARLHAADTTEARLKIGPILEKSLVQIHRANALVHQLRALLSKR